MEDIGGALSSSIGLHGHSAILPSLIILKQQNADHVHGLPSAAINPKKATPKPDEYIPNRKQFPKNQWGVSAASSSKQFKQISSNHLPVAKPWSQILSKEAHLRKGSSLKQAARYLSTPGLISLGGGIPSSEYIPYESLSIKVPKFGSDSRRTWSEPGVIQVGKHDLTEDKSLFDIATAFNYCQGSGSAQLLRWITEHTEMMHRPPYQDWGCTMTVGSTFALDVALRLFTNPGDVILSEDYAFATAVETAAPMGVKILGIPMDEQGILPSELDAILSSWDEESRGQKKPVVLYTVPSGQNPTGATQGLERRKELYKTAQKHDLYIFEDEPYYFLQMPPYIPGESSPMPSSHQEYLDGLIPSLLSLDVDGRVLRMDSFSKVLAPGARLGWITASEEIVQRYQQHAELSTQGPSGMSQLLLFKLIDDHWGHGGYIDWLVHVREEYTKRRNSLLQACETYLPSTIVSWTPPRAGMFLWLRINWKHHPQAHNKSLLEIEEEIFHACIKHGTLAMRGSWFYAESNVERDSMFFRATYAAASSDQMHKAIERFGDAIRDVFGTNITS